MRFEVSVNLYPGLFHTVPIQGAGTYIILSTKTILATDDLWVSDFELFKSVDSVFTAGLVGEGGYATSESLASAYLFHSTLSVNNYGTAVLGFSRSAKVSGAVVDPEQTTAVFRNQHFYAYTARSIGTLLTCGDVHDDLQSFLTMI